MKTPSRKIQSRAKNLSITPSRSLYEKDFVKWIDKQANLLKEKKLDKLDIKNLIEEIESLGKSDKRALHSHLIVLLQHLLKQKYQPDFNCNSWKSSITNAKIEIGLILSDSPSLKKEMEKFFEDAYLKAKKWAADETELPLKTFPQESPWKLKEILKDL